VSGLWFTHPNHSSVERFVCELPMTYFRLEAHDCYGGSTGYEMDTLFRMFLLKELHGARNSTR
jgi:hypothetical protein